MKFSLEPREEEFAGGKKRKERVKKTIARVFGISSMMRDLDEDDEEEEDVAPAQKSQKLMGDAIKSGAAPSKPKTAPKSSGQASNKQHPRDPQEISQLQRRTRPQCLKFRKMMSH